MTPALRHVGQRSQRLPTHQPPSQPGDAERDQDTNSQGQKQFGLLELQILERGDDACDVVVILIYHRPTQESETCRSQCESLHS